MDDQKIIASLSNESGHPVEEIKKMLKAYFKALKHDLNTGMTISIEGFGKISGRKLTESLTHEKRSATRTSPKASDLMSVSDVSATYGIHPGDPKTKGILFQEYHYDTIEEIHNTNTKKILSELISTIGIEQKVLAEKVFDITPNTLRAYRQEKNKELSPRLKELAMSIQSLYTKGTEIFLDIAHFNIWLNQKQTGLEDRKPIELINTVAGIHMVMEELFRIEFGATA